MNKTQLVDLIASNANISKVTAKKTLNAFVEVSTQILKQDGKVSISGFGSFSVTQKSGRIGRNPRTGATIKIAPKRVVKFKPGAELNAQIE